jgi:glycosyltransferase A (GT-A) superfamily protein (DUF2064 family)
MTKKQRVVMIGLEGAAKLAQWVAEGTTLEERRARAAFAKVAVGEMLDGVDHAATNKALRDEAKRQSHGDPR